MKKSKVKKQDFILIKNVTWVLLNQNIDFDLQQKTKERKIENTNKKVFKEKDSVSFFLRKLKMEISQKAFTLNVKD